MTSFVVTATLFLVLCIIGSCQAAFLAHHSSIGIRSGSEGTCITIDRHTKPFAALSFTKKINSLVSTTSKTTTTRLYDGAEELELVVDDAEERMTKSVQSVKQNLMTIRTGRASASMLDLVEVDYYGAKTPLNQMATISVPSAQQLSISPFDKSTLADVERAIVDSDLGLTPNNDGSLIRINIPALTEERRKEMMKKCKAIGEDGKVAVRNIRRDGIDSIKKLEKAGDLGEDESKDGQDGIQKATDKFVKEIDGIVTDKEKEVMTL